ncbi:hypothetical protein pb186bvf_006594 [Paramecium bursaria]
MYAKLAQGLKSFDLLGLEINLQMNGLKTYNTYPGVICTLVLMAFVMYSFIQMVNDIQNGANPVTSKTSLYLSQNEGFSFPANTFIFVAYVGDSNGLFIKNTAQKTYYTLTFRRRVFSASPKIEYLDFGPCSNNSLAFFGLAGKSLPSTWLSCISDDIFFKDGGVEIQNSFRLANFTKYQFQINRCVNSTTANYVCASNEEIDAKLQNAIVTFSFPLYEYNALNYTHPYQVKVALRQMTINPQNIKVTNIVYKQSQSLTEQNTFYFFPTQKLDLGLEYYESYLDLQSGAPNGYIGGVQLYLDDQKYVYHRQYQNIFNIFGTIGGTFSVLRTILMILLQPIQKLSFATIMFNRLSNKKKHLRIVDYFKSPNQRQVIKEQYQIIQKAIELESYMEIMLKFENDLLTFRSDKLVIQNPNLFKSQRLQMDKSNDMGSQRIDQLDIIEQQSQNQQVMSSKRMSFNSQDYIVNDER